ncbi:hypothetical protein D9M71_674220 [compost metagenome]
MPPIAHGPPVILLSDPVLLARQRCALRVTQAMLDHAAKQSGNAQAILEPRAGIGDAQFHRWVVTRWADHPPAIVALAQRSGAFEQRQVTLVGLPVAQPLRQTHVRPFTTRHLAVTLVAGGLALPER